jgi:hypothetical protein
MAFRNPTAHEPKIYWPINEQDALDLLSLISLLHRRLDEVTGNATENNAGRRYLRVVTESREPNS